jgi:hypothetical protein
VIPVLHNARDKLLDIITENDLNRETILVKIGQLTPEDAIGITQRKDFPILEGKEVIVEAGYRDSYGHAFTSYPRNFKGTLEEVISLDLNVSGNRAVFVSTLNAVTAELGFTSGSRHCRNDEPERCGVRLAEEMLNRFGTVKVGLVGLQPAILENLSLTFGSGNVRCTDLNPKNIGAEKYGVEIQDGKQATYQMIRWCRLVLVTSSTMVNGTFDDIRQEARKLKRKLIVFGVSGSGIASLLNIERICPYGH